VSFTFDGIQRFVHSFPSAGKRDGSEWLDFFFKFTGSVKKFSTKSLKKKTTARRKIQKGEQGESTATNR
jgi:hypothetical protein